MKRRTFLKTVGSIATGGALGVQSISGGCEQATSTGTIEKVAGLPRRVLGRTGQKVSIVETDSSNIKITTKSDVAIAEAIIKSRIKAKPKGYVGPYGNEAKW